MSDDFIDNIGLLVGLTVIGFVLIFLGVTLENALFGLVGGAMLILPAFKLILLAIDITK